MSIFKCKMCGGSLEVTAGETIIECEYCGTQQTLPKTTDENIQALFNRANLLRQKNEFDKAEAVYEKILEADDTEAEAYWGVILCKFGIEYVEDPKTYKRIPTCHRTSYDSIVADEYYKKALEYADIAQRSIYEVEAKKIDEIQKGILAISAQEEPYDVFICYKETDESGKRTQDSVIANDIYYQLTQEGFKVFYAAITLEDKLGSAYEPIIFAALNSSKVMLSIGTKPEYFNAVWVKNEWSRFLKMMKNDRSKMLIPCYKGMDAYELPEEFAHLQAQDMGKIGFINDIVRGIKKVIVKDEPKTTIVKETVVTSSNSSVDPLLKRAFMFLEDEEWDSAKEYAEKVLDIDPENAKAYLVKFLAEYDLKNCSYIVDAFSTPFFKDESADFQKAMRFGDEVFREELNGYIKAINERNEHDRLQGIYDDAKSKMKLNTHAGYLEAAKLFESISFYLDAQKLIGECREKAEVCRKNDIYNNAMSEVGKASVASFVKAIELFKTISGWKDADEQVAKCEAKLPELRDKEEKERIERERKAEQERISKTKRNKMLKLLAIISAVIVVAVVSVIIITSAMKKSDKYSEIVSLKDSGNYAEAYNLCKDLLDYKDCADIYSQLETVILEDANKLYLAGDASAAANLLSKCNIRDPGYNYIVSGDYKKAVNAGLTHIVIPNGVSSIGFGAFEDCDDLTAVTIPSSVTSIGKDAFLGAGHWSKGFDVYISDLSSWCKIKFASWTSNPLYCGSGVLYLNGELVEQLVIPGNVHTISDYAFQGTKSVKTLILQEGVVEIGVHAFDGCSMTTISIPSTVIKIGDWAFCDCESLTSISIPNSVVEIGNRVFWSCDNLSSVTLPNSINKISEGMFSYCGNLTNITLPNSITKIEDNAFDSCKKLTSINIPNGVKHIGEQAFSMCALTSIVLPDNMEYLGEWAFYGCDFKTIKIPEGITAIYKSTFEFCYELTEVTLPSTLKSIGTDAFGDCKALKTIRFRGTSSQWYSVSKSSGWLSGVSSSSISYIYGS